MSPHADGRETRPAPLHGTAPVEVVPADVVGVVGAEVTARGVVAVVDGVVAAVVEGGGDVALVVATETVVGTNVGDVGRELIGFTGLAPSADGDFPPTVTAVVLHSRTAPVRHIATTTVETLGIRPHG